jgi:hypothetical protein
MGALGVHLSCTYYSFSFFFEWKLPIAVPVCDLIHNFFQWKVSGDIESWHLAGGMIQYRSSVPFNPPHVLFRVRCRG